MRILIVCASTEGHTRDLCAFMQRCLTADGHEVTLVDAIPATTEVDPRDYDAALLAASLHVGRYQPALVRFAHAHRHALNSLFSAFLSVSAGAKVPH